VDKATRKDIGHKPFIAHLHELQKRLMWVALFIAAFSLAAYTVHGHLLNLLRSPLGQNLYYTSPMGGFTFLFKLCFITGLILAIPVIIYHIFEFLGPMLKKKQRSVIITYTFWSFILAMTGITFAYFVSLPSALHFLTQFSDKGIESLIGVDEYFNFALAYVGGLALLFQIPLLLLFINRITPLSPRKMMKTQKYMVVGSFIIAAILTPTPDPFNQTLMALPMIVLYQISIILVWLVNKRARASTASSEDIAITEEIFHAIVADTSKPKVSARRTVIPVQASPIASSVKATMKPISPPQHEPRSLRERYRKPTRSASYSSRPLVYQKTPQNLDGFFFQAGTQN
jgi:sec-independent protein translocase protein TatC